MGLSRQLQPKKSQLGINAGGCLFLLETVDKKLIGRIAKLFDQAEASHQSAIYADLDRPLENTVEPLAAAGVAVVDWILAVALQNQQGKIWLDASSLRSSSGKNILIAGGSHSGKTTLSLAAACAHFVQIVSEDVSFIDKDRRTVISFVAPLSLRDGTIQRFHGGDRLSTDLVFGQWIYLPTLYNRADISLPFDIIVLNDQIDVNHQAGFNCLPCGEAECLRFLLPLSNALRLVDGSARLAEAIAGAAIYKISGGTVDERVEWLHAIS